MKWLLATIGLIAVTAAYSLGVGVPITEALLLYGVLLLVFATPYESHEEPDATPDQDPDEDDALEELISTKLSVEGHLIDTRKALISAAEERDAAHEEVGSLTETVTELRNHLYAINQAIGLKDGTEYTELVTHVEARIGSNFATRAERDAAREELDEAYEALGLPGQRAHAGLADLFKRAREEAMREQGVIGSIRRALGVKSGVPNKALAAEVEGLRLNLNGVCDALGLAAGTPYCSLPGRVAHMMTERGTAGGGAPPVDLGTLEYGKVPDGVLVERIRRVIGFETGQADRELVSAVQHCTRLLAETAKALGVNGTHVDQVPTIAAELLASERQWRSRYQAAGLDQGTADEMIKRTWAALSDVPLDEGIALDEAVASLARDYQREAKRRRAAMDRSKHMRRVLWGLLPEPFRRPCRSLEANVGALAETYEDGDKLVRGLRNLLSPENTGVPSEDDDLEAQGASEVESSLRNALNNSPTIQYSVKVNRPDPVRKPLSGGGEA